MPLRKWRTISVCLLLVWTIGSGCARNEARLGDDVTADTGPSPSTFTPPPGADAAPDAPVVTALMCIGTTCPAPFATCFAETGPTYKCGIDLARDPDNCGACGNKCQLYEPIALSGRCVEGACELECLNKPGSLTDYRNCNGTVDDGCESDVTSDAKNCGVCGNACQAGSSCIKGKCGCPAGLIECPGPDGPRCTNPNVDDANCGGCGNVCAQPAGACSPMPNRAYYGCGGGTCGHLKCGGYASDCNGDLAALACKSDGCEVEDVRTDRNNCGGCGISCAGAQECIDEGNGYECAVPCARFGKTACPDGRCVDLLGDVYSCGGCGNACPAAGPHQVRSCDKGLCAVDCAPGFADCNGSSADGCEVNLQTHAGNCGACGTACDVGAGQPCVEGKCLMSACDAGATK